jgi:hypothetical protein
VGEGGPGAGAVVGANASGRSRFRYARENALTVGPGDRNIGDVGIYVKTCLAGDNG